MKKLVVYLGIMVFAISCEKEMLSPTNQEDVKAYYKMSYDEKTNITKVSATFSKYTQEDFENDPFAVTIELDQNQFVSFNNDTLYRTTNPVTGKVMYERVYAGFIPLGEFNFRGVGNAIYTNYASIDSISAESFPDTVSLDTNYRTSWIGLPVGTFEKVELRIHARDKLNYPDALIVKWEGQVGENTFDYHFDSFIFDEVRDVEATVKRTKTQGLQQSNNGGGNITTSYKSREKLLVFE